MRILVTGGTGMVGSAFDRIKSNHKIISFGSQTYDLRNEQDVCDMIYRTQPDAIIHLAAKVGGIKGNMDYVADFFYENMIMNLNVLNIAKMYKIPKVLSILSTCVYPDKAKYPLTEDQIHNGEPHSSNFGYAYAKRMLEVHSRVLRQQYGLNYITAVPNNIYGPNDNFDLQNSHVVPAIIRKIYEANKNKTNPVFWGSGKPLREFTYVDDIARALILLIENYDSPEPINIGNTQEISIFDLVGIISNNMGISFPDECWDTSMPEGQYKKPASNKRFNDLFPNFKYTSLNEGINITTDWFVKNYPNIRGL